ncbi:MAG: TetR/AcrR family transcriptional regulator [Candidatus Dadabacteria bacterium]|nr:MAG: TetR/AcrR family transcriptional regulator [Candidatus Dadabacteria bacterium]
MRDGKASLLEAAEALFADRGYSATSVRDICQAAGVTQPSLYHFFGSKEKLLWTLIEDRFGTYCDELEQTLAEADDAKAVFQAYAEYVLSRMQRVPVTAKFVFSIMFGPQQDIPRSELVQRLSRSRGILSDRLDRVAPEIEPQRRQFVAVVMHGLVTPAVLQFLVSGRSTFPEQLPEILAVRAASMLQDDLPVCDWGVSL